MNCRERELRTLSFSNEGLDRGAVIESMYPWDKTVRAWDEQGLHTGFLDKVHFATLPTDNLYARNTPYEPWEYYYNTMMTESVFDHEQALELDPVKRICFRIPFISFDEETLEDTDTYTIRRDKDGWTRKYPKNGGLVQDIRPVVTDEDDWEMLKAHTLEALEKWCTPENMEKAYGPYREGTAYPTCLLPVLYPPSQRGHVRMAWRKRNLTQSSFPILPIFPIFCFPHLSPYSIAKGSSCQSAAPFFHYSG